MMTIDWTGPYGGLPPFGVASPEDIEAGLETAMRNVSDEVRRIREEAQAPGFQNTVLALDRALVPLRRAEAVLGVVATTAATPEVSALRSRLAPRLAAFEAELWSDAALYARFARLAPDEGWSAVDRRLLELLKRRFVRRGVALGPDERARLAEVEARLAELQAQFARNLADEEQQQFTLVDDARELDGLSEDFRDAAAALASHKGTGGWAIANTRIAATTVLQNARSPALRKRVRDLHVTRGANAGLFDNRPLIPEILRLRAEKARLLGYASFAHYQTADKMAGTPDAAMKQLRDTWQPVLERTLADLAEVEAMAAAEGMPTPLAPSDHSYYSERLRERRFALDSEAIRQHLSLENVMAALFDAMGRLHGLRFIAVPDAPRLSPKITAYEVRRNSELVGIVWFDLIRRAGKQPGSWQQELRPHAAVPVRQVPLSIVVSSLEPQADGTVLMDWDYAKVVFHEFGHALHMLLNRAPYEGLGPMGVEWDMIELPSQLNERWLLDRDLLKRFAKHHRTGEPMPDPMIDAILAAQKQRRVTSAWVEYLAPAIVDLGLHSVDDPKTLDPFSYERGIYDELGMPPSIDPLMRLPHQYHSFATEVYAGAIYAYLWADVIVAETLQLFDGDAGSLYDPATAVRWREHVLGAGAMRSGADAIRALLAREPDPQAFLKRFDLIDA